MEKNSYLRSVGDVLCSGASFVSDPGLLHGKTGMMLFLYRLSRVLDDKKYSLYADELLDEVLESICADTPLDFASGLSGIGWSLDYLIKNGYIDPESQEVLIDFDELPLSMEYWLARGDRDKLTQTALALLAEAGDDDPETIFQVLLMDGEARVLPPELARELFEGFLARTDDLYQTCTTWSGWWLVTRLCERFGCELPELIRPTNMFLVPPIVSPGDVRLADMLELSRYKLRYGIPLTPHAAMKSMFILKKPDLMHEWIELSSPRAMGLSGYMTGFGWLMMEAL